MLSATEIESRKRPLTSATPAEAGRQLRVLIVHRYYFPDTPPIAFMLRTIAERWTALGHDVTVFAGHPCYKPNVAIPRQSAREILGGVDIQRCWLPFAKSRNPLIRVFNFVLFLFFAFWKIVLQRKKYDVVMCLSFPPVASGVVVSAASRIRGSKFIYYLLDIHPESSIFSGKLKQNGWIAKLTRRFDRRSCNLAQRVVVLSDDMANTWLNRYPVDQQAKQRCRMRVIPDFNPTAFDRADQETVLPEQFAKRPGTFRLVFAGNIGEFQAIENLIQTAQLLAEYREIEFLFVGDGSVKARAIEQTGELNGSTVHFHPHQTVPVADCIMRTADLCIVSLSPNLFRVAFPCKTSSYLAMGCPLLVVLEEESELFRMTVENQLGFACRGEDPEALKDTILRARDNPAQIEAMRGPARAFAEKHLIPVAVLVKWEKLIQEFLPDFNIIGNANSSRPARGGAVT